jgi:hypothetical protein
MAVQLTNPAVAPIQSWLPIGTACAHGNMQQADAKEFEPTWQVACKHAAILVSKEQHA